MAMRITINLNEQAQNALDYLNVQYGGSFRVRGNTIVKAAVIAFAEADEETVRRYIRKVISQDGRFAKSRFCV